MSREAIVRWAIAAGLTALIALVGLVSRKFLAGRIARLLSRTRTDLDDILLASVSSHVPLWFLVLGVVLGLRYAKPDPVVVTRADRVAVAVLLLSITFATASFLSRLVASRSLRWTGGLPATTLSQNAVRIAVISLGSLVVLGNLGIAITPLLTALGVSSLAVALALQPTLSNLIAGFHISLARRVRIGDYIELETGHQGYVADISWRSTQIRELPNNLVVVPNARLAEVIVRNYALPETQQSALVQVGVAYDSDLQQVERVTIETARDVQRSVAGAVPEFDPFIRYHTFGDSSIGFSVILRVKEFTDRYLVTHEFIRRLRSAYEKAAIEIPFPQRVVHMARDQAAARPPMAS